MRKITTAIVTAVLLAAASQGVAQSIVLKDGSKLGPDQFKIEGGKVMKIVKVGSNVATSVLQMSGVLKLEWPMPVELTEGTALLASGKTEEGLAMLKKGRDLFEPFKDVPGNHFADLSFAYVEALGQAGKFEDTIKAMPALRLLKLTDAQKTKLKIIQLEHRAPDLQRLRLHHCPGAEHPQRNRRFGRGGLLVDDSGRCLLQAEAVGKALLAYLRVPVFYGSQVQRVPEAEMAAAGALAKMRRFEDAAGFYKRIVEAYPGSGMAEKAKTEEAAIRGLKNESDAPAKTDAPAADAKAADAAPAKRSSSLFSTPSPTFDMKPTPHTHSMQIHPVKALFRAGLCAALLFGSLVMFSPVQAQEAADLKPGETKVIHKKKSLIDIWHEGGWVMYPLGLCSVALVWLTVDLRMRTSVKKLAPPAYIQQLQDLFRAGD